MTSHYVTYHVTSILCAFSCHRLIIYYCLIYILSKSVHTLSYHNSTPKNSKGMISASGINNPLHWSIVTLWNVFSKIIIFYRYLLGTVHTWQLRSITDSQKADKYHTIQIINNLWLRKIKEGYFIQKMERCVTTNTRREC